MCGTLLPPVDTIADPHTDPSLWRGEFGGDATDGGGNVRNTGMSYSTGRGDPDDIRSFSSSTRNGENVPVDGSVKGLTFKQQREMIEAAAKSDSEEPNAAADQATGGTGAADAAGADADDDTAPQGRDRTDSEVLPHDMEERMHRQLAKAQLASDTVIEPNFIDQFMSWVFLHPYARLFVACGIAFLNFWILLEDPIAHSAVGAEVPIIGQVWALIFAQWPSAAGLSLFKLLSIAAGVAIGTTVGKKIVHRRLLRGKLAMFRNDQGSIMIMFWCSLLSLFVASNLYNAFVPATGAGPSLLLTNNMGISNEIFSKIAGICCWMGDYLTMFLVIDSMLQDKTHYKKWAKCLRKLWKGRFRIVSFWVLTPMALIVVTLIVDGDSAVHGTSVWDSINIIPSGELGRCFMCAVITVFVSF